MFLIITMIFLAITMTITLFRMIIGPTLWDRLMALNLMAAKTVMLITLYAVYKNNIALLDVSMTYGIIGFLGITLLCRFILRGGRHK
ncbi:monovalent cation/H+ antiporter complex subunit F [Clostridium ganghwense]|uniref:Monovalent cation/H+ antiporter complex subunit F n=1 Tax=Clostridium ganghwense TaxID=312089 RepID=A0ABT4CJB6_9CLOT|nr:monovalent cation/H+ antiporter complex subunit F [Clostridium ganghwense]MCY6369143.1 monovalent cation/H+ antiporter complex subunit F [Clostridium ganghwense]